MQLSEIEGKQIKEKPILLLKISWHPPFQRLKKSLLLRRLGIFLAKICGFGQNEDRLETRSIHRLPLY
jgi:hypothetical protein